MDSLDPLLFNGFLLRYLYLFFQCAFSIMEPGISLTEADYLRVLCFELQKVTRGDTRRLIINMPPRHLKSLICSAAWAAWMLALDPKKKIGIVCYDQNLAGDMAKRLKRLLESRWFQTLAPNVKISQDRNLATNFSTTAGGHIFATSIGATLTGFGFDVIILDDPQSAVDAGHDNKLKETVDLFDRSVSSRLNDPAHGAIVVVQQRLHDADLTGSLLERGNWKHLCMPLVATEQKTYEIDDGKFWTRRVGEILCPERVTENALREIQARPHVYQAQYQQNPSAAIGSYIRPDQLRSIPQLPSAATSFCLSIDTAVQISETSSFTAFVVFATDGRHHYVVDVICDRMDIIRMRETALRLITNYRGLRVLIENSASGYGLHCMLREAGKASKLISVGSESKIDRLERCLHFFLDGRVFTVGDAQCMADYANELLRFPYGKRNDRVDATTNYLNETNDSGPPPITTSGGGGYGWPTRNKHHERDADRRPRSPNPFRRR